MDYIKIVKEKGEWDFEVSGLCADIKREELGEFRSMIITAIYVAEDMWRRNQKNEASQSIK